MRALLLLGILLSPLLSASLRAQDDDDRHGPRPRRVAEAKAQFETNSAAFKGDADKLVLPGLVADRKTRTVEILAESTGLTGGEVAEFLLVDQGSSHGYEALLWSFAKPSDVHRALEFIGLTPGTPQNPALPRLWSDGDRVNVQVSAPDGDASFPIEHMIVDNKTEARLPAEGFIFAGSITIKAPDGSGKRQYVADSYDPRSVASLYSEPAAVLDVPRQVSQGEAYGNQVINPEYALTGGELLKIVMTPADPDGRSRTRHLVLAIASGSASNVVACRLSEEEGDVLHAGLPLKDMLGKIESLRSEDTDCMITLSFGDTLPIAEVARACAVLGMMEVMGIVKIKPPGEGELYYRAFVPDKAWMTPEKRPTQPWELHLARKEGTLTGTMVLHEAVWADGSIEPTFTRAEFPAPTPGAIRARLDQDAREREKASRRPLPGVLLIFAEPGLAYRDVLSFIAPVLTTHDTIYVFAGE